MKKRIIINYDEKLKPADVLLDIITVIQKGKISKVKGKKQYCFLSVHTGFLGDQTFIAAKPKYKTETDVFDVWHEEKS
jgi:hypothetical protein